MGEIEQSVMSTHDLLRQYLEVRHFSEEEREAQMIFSRCVTDALYPFRARRINTELTADPATGDYRLRVYTDLLVDDIAEVVIPRSRLEKFVYAWDFALHAANEVYRYFASIYVQPEDNIILGDS